MEVLLNLGGTRRSASVLSVSLASRGRVLPLH